MRKESMHQHTKESSRRKEEQKDVRHTEKI